MSQALQLLKDGVAAAKAGNKVLARQLIRQVVEQEPRNETAWLWLAGLAESPLESVHFLEKVLEINPQHEKARAPSAPPGCRPALPPPAPRTASRPGPCYRKRSRPTRATRWPGCGWPASPSRSRKACASWKRCWK